jgi:2,3-bisphosphoglycerate-dependent phosphoglycerate mutase
MLLYFIRHGQSANNRLYDLTNDDIGRVCDPELTEAGVKQAARVAEALRNGQPLFRSNAEEIPGFGVTHLYCSLMLRAVNTGQAIAHSLNLPLVGWTDLHEGGGMFLEDPDRQERVGQPGGSRTELTVRFPELVWPGDACESGWWNSRPFESHAERPIRAQRVLTELLRRHGDTKDRVVFVSHGGFFYRFMCAVFNIADPDGLWFHMYNTAITCFEFEKDHKPQLRYHNRLDHLPYDLIT